MAKLKLFTAFHLNLAFSSIPEDQYAMVIDRCYWPMLDLLEKHENLKFGLEMTGYTLEKINEIDYTFVEKMKELMAKGRCEVIGSGLSQAIFTLIPQKVNEKNLELGNKIYSSILGEVPKVAYVNEQCFSDGLTDLYLKAGYKSLIMEYENAKLFNTYEKEAAYWVNPLKSPSGKTLDIVWNSSIAFQKLQRYAFGEIKLEEYLDYLSTHVDLTKDRTLCLYGSDLEIFDYKPGNHDGKFMKTPSKEIKALELLFENLSKAETDYEFVLPSTLEVSPKASPIQISTAAYPLVCKKQPKYNAVRWAVTGIKNTKMNSECYRLFDQMEKLEKQGYELGRAWETLCLLFGSDFRTRTTESKINEYHFLLGKLQSDLLDLSKPPQNRGKTVFITHLGPEDSAKNATATFVRTFKEGEAYLPLKAVVKGAFINIQLEDIDYYKDQSLRSCTVVVELPSLKPQEKIQLDLLDSKDLEHGKNPPLTDETASESNKDASVSLSNNLQVKTPSVDIEFSSVKKGTVERLSFKSHEGAKVLGNIKHGTYDDIRFSADYYSGHTILRGSDLTQITDLDRSDLFMPEALEEYPIWVPVKSKIKGEFGELWKIYKIYKNSERLDIEYHFKFNDLSPVFFRTGILTFGEDFFNEEKLTYELVNGGHKEKYSLFGTNFNQSDMVSLNVSASSCLGATDGVLALSDEEKKVFIHRDNAQLYTVPMLEYREIQGKYFLRLYHSLSESDDTGKIFWRGHSQFKMAITTSEKDPYGKNFLIL